MPKILNKYCPPTKLFFVFGEAALSQGIPHFSMNTTLCELAESLHAQEIIVAMDERRGKLPIPYYSERHTVQPGITGWTQVSAKIVLLKSGAR